MPSENKLKMEIWQALNLLICLEWFSDYLFCRSQAVQCEDVLSEAQPVFTGVPQGSIVGPVLVIISATVFNEIITYADNSVIYTSAKNIATIQRNLSEDSNNLCYWFEEN